VKRSVDLDGRYPYPFKYRGQTIDSLDRGDVFVFVRNRVEHRLHRELKSLHWSPYWRHHTWTACYANGAGHRRAILVYENDDAFGRQMISHRSYSSGAAAFGGWRPKGITPDCDPFAVGQRCEDAPLDLGKLRLARLVATKPTKRIQKLSFYKHTTQHYLKCIRLTLIYVNVTIPSISTYVADVGIFSLAMFLYFYFFDVHDTSTKVYDILVLEYM